MALTYLLFQRYEPIISGEATAFDTLVFLVWVCLLLSPIFQEISLPGVKLKQEIEELKTFVRHEVGEIKNAVDVRTTFSPQINLSPPPPVADPNLPEFEAVVQKSLSEIFERYGQSPVVSTGSNLSAPDDINFLFGMRFNLEKEVVRLAEIYGFSRSRRPVAVGQVVTYLLNNDAIEVSLEKAIRQVYAICSAGIHGADVSAAQIGFVKDVGPDLIAALKAIN
tara:strand:+ start:1297 stop:1965 length:669 start_codon:yes stop_codon:yes gene_type:complete